MLAPGQFVVDTNVEGAAPSGGIVGELRVREGDLVAAGDLLIRLDETITRANLQIVTKQLDELEARQARLEAERDGAGGVRLPEASRPGPGGGGGQADGRRAGPVRAAPRDRESQKEQLRKRIAQLKDEIGGLKAQQAAKIREAAFIAEELRGVRELYQKNLVQLTRLSALEREAASLEGQRGQLLAAMAQAAGKIAETELQILQIDAEARAEVMKELREIQGRMAELGERRVAADDQLKRVEIRAPSAGTVHQLAVHTVGGVISPAEPAMLIVPLDEALNLEARVLPPDIDQLALGQRATVRVQASTPAPPGDPRHPHPHRRRRQPRPADRRQLLHHPGRPAGRRGRPPRRPAPRRRHAGRGLRPDPRPHPPAVLPQTPPGPDRRRPWPSDLQSGADPETEPAWRTDDSRLVQVLPRPSRSAPTPVESGRRSISLPGRAARMRGRWPSGRRGVPPTGFDFEPTSRKQKRDDEIR